MSAHMCKVIWQIASQGRCHIWQHGRIGSLRGVTLQVHKRQPLTRYRLQKIISARETDLLEPDPPPNLGHLETYADSTASQLLQLQVT